MNRRTARSVFSIRSTSGVPPDDGNTPATSEFLCTSKTTNLRTTVGATELTSGTGWSSTDSYAALAAWSRHPRR
jgi:hypothetical protein